MKNIPDGSIDAIITDPPYGITACKWDIIIPFELMWERLNKLIKPNGAIVLFGREPFSSALRMSNIKNYKYDWVWKKQPTLFQHCKNRPMQVTENISVFSLAKYGHKSQVKNRMVYYPIGVINLKIKKVQRFSVNYLGERPNQVGKEYMAQTGFPNNLIEIKRERKTVHPTQKPVALMEYLIKTYTNEGETILDFAAGSGTTGVACINTNRNYILIEKEKKYISIIETRINYANNEKKEYKPGNKIIINNIKDKKENQITLFNSKFNNIKKKK